MAIPILDDVYNWVTSRLNSVYNTINNIINFVNGSVQGVWSSVNNLWDYAQRVADYAYDSVQWVINQVPGMVNSAVQSALSAYNWVLAQAQRFFSTGLNAIYRNIETLFNSVNNVYSDISAWVSSNIQNLYDWVIARVEDITALLNEVFDLLNTPERFFDLIERTIEAVW